MKKLGWFAAIAQGMATHLASAAVVYTAVLSGAAESPPNASPAAPATQVPTFVGFPPGISLGSHDQLFDLTELSSWNPAFVTAHGGTAASAEGPGGDRTGGTRLAAGPALVVESRRH